MCMSMTRDDSEDEKWNSPKWHTFCHTWRMKQTVTSSKARALHWRRAFSQVPLRHYWWTRFRPPHTHANRVGRQRHELISLCPFKIVQNLVCSTSIQSLFAAALTFFIFVSDLLGSVHLLQDNWSRLEVRPYFFPCKIVNRWAVWKSIPWKGNQQMRPRFF